MAASSYLPTPRMPTLWRKPQAATNRWRDICALTSTASGTGDYFALLAYIQMNAEHEALLQKLRQALRDQKRVATCLEFGPRFLHSTGQAYKGGPNSGVFLQITCDDAADLARAGAEVHLRHGQSGAGPGRLPGSGGTRPPGFAGASGQRPASGLERLSAAFHQALT